ncbi:MAG: DUF4199 domain-containing protein [Flammeovirgaceae bacterium]
MKKIVLVYGAIAGAVVAVMMLITMPMYEKGTLNIESGELLGYSTMVVALSLVFFGIKTYRDSHQNGQITFWKALQVGLLISLLASAIYALTWEYSYANMSPDYRQKMTEMYYDKMKKEGATEDELKDQKEMFEFYNSNLLFRFSFTAMVEMFPVGLVISLISAGLLRKKEFLPATEKA